MAWRSSGDTNEELVRNLKRKFLPALFCADRSLLVSDRASIKSFSHAVFIDCRSNDVRIWHLIVCVGAISWRWRCIVGKIAAQHFLVPLYLKCMWSNCPRSVLCHRNESNLPRPSSKFLFWYTHSPTFSKNLTLRLWYYFERYCRKGIPRRRSSSLRAKGKPCLTGFVADATRHLIVAELVFSRFWDANCCKLIHSCTRAMSSWHTPISLWRRVMW